MNRVPLLLAGVAIALATCKPAHAQDASQCKPLTELLPMLLDRFGERVVALLPAPPAGRYWITTNPETGTYSVIMEPAHREALGCIAFAGGNAAWVGLDLPLPTPDGENG